MSSLLSKSCNSPLDISLSCEICRKRARHCSEVSAVRCSEMQDLAYIITISIGRCWRNLPALYSNRSSSDEEEAWPGPRWFVGRKW